VWWLVSVCFFVCESGEVSVGCGEGVGGCDSGGGWELVGGDWWVLTVEGRFGGGGACVAGRVGRLGCRRRLGGE